MPLKPSSGPPSAGQPSWRSRPTTARTAPAASAPRPPCSHRRRAGSDTLWMSALALRLRVFHRSKSLDMWPGHAKRISHCVRRFCSRLVTIASRTGWPVRRACPGMPCRIGWRVGATRTPMTTRKPHCQRTWVSARERCACRPGTGWTGSRSRACWREAASPWSIAAYDWHAASCRSPSRSTCPSGLALRERRDTGHVARRRRCERFRTRPAGLHRRRAACSHAASIRALMRIVAGAGAKTAPPIASCPIARGRPCSSLAREHARAADATALRAGSRACSARWRNCMPQAACMARWRRATSSCWPAIAQCCWTRRRARGAGQRTDAKHDGGAAALRGAASSRPSPASESSAGALDRSVLTGRDAAFLHHRRSAPARPNAAGRPACPNRWAHRHRERRPCRHRARSAAALAGGAEHLHGRGPRTSGHRAWRS